MKSRKFFKLPIPLLIAIAIVLLSGGGYLIYALTKSTENTGPVGYWKFDEGSGYTAYDSSGNSINGTLKNFDFDDDSNWESGKVAGALEFDGTNDYVDVPDQSATLWDNDFSLSVWVKTDTVANGSAYIVSAAGTRNSELRRNTSTIEYKIWTGAVEQKVVSPTISAGVWYHVVFTRSKTNGMKLYLNGNLEATNTYTGDAASRSMSDSIGQLGDNSNYWDGSIDEVKIWDRALSADEIAWEFNRGGPVGWWKFDYFSAASTTPDSSGNGNHGTVYGATSTAGKINGALSFDGTNDYVDVGNGATLAITDTITIESWVYYNDDPAHSHVSILSKWDDPVSAYWADIVFGTPRFYVNLSGTNPANLSAKTALPIGSWTHLVYVADGSYLRIYTNGKLDSNPLAFSSPIESSTGRLYIGSNNGERYFLQALIDDVRVYNYARTEAEIRMDYNGGFAAKLGDGDYDLARGLVGYWPMNEGSGYTAYDSSGIGNKGTLKNFDFNVNSGWTTGKVEGALKLDGSNDYINAGSNTSLDDLSSFTYSLWIKPSSWTPSGYKRLISKGAQQPYNDLIVRTDQSGKLHYERTYSGEDLFYLTTNQVSLNTWSHVALTVASGTAHIYINGAEASYDNATNGTGVITSDAASDFLIGDRVLGDSRFYGSIDDVRAYNRELSADEVRYLYNHRGPVGWWKFDSFTASTTPDSSGNGNNGTVYGATSTAGKINTALSFDGADDYVGMGANLNSFTNVTLSAWVKLSGYNASWRSGIISRRRSDGGLEGLNFDVGGALQNQGQLLVYEAGLGGIESNGVLSLDTWYFVTTTIFGTDVSIYIDGVLDKTGTLAWTWPSDVDIQIGKVFGTSYYFNGLIDDVRVYNYARTAEEIRMDYNGGFVAKFGSSDESGGESINLSRGLVGYWNFDEGSGYTVKDSSGSGNNGTLNNFDFNSNSKWTSGNSAANTGGALKFDGSNDFVDAGSDASLDLSAFTIGLWVKPAAYADNRFVVSHGYNGSNVQRNYEIGFGWGSHSGKWVFVWGDGVAGDKYTLSDTYTLNEWQYLTVSWDDSTGHLKTYFNGVLTWDRGIGGTIYQNANNRLIFGAEYWGYPATSDRFNGSLDEVRIYNRVLSNDEVRYMYNRKQPIGHWKFDEGQGQKAYDSSINGNHGTLGSTTASDAGDPSWATGTINRALSFDGTNDYVNGGTGSTTDMTTNDFTLSAWIKTSATPDSNQDIIYKRSGAIGYAMMLSSGGLLKFFLGDSGGWTSPTAGSDLRDGNWHHAAISFDRDGNALFYADGKHIGSESISARSTTLSNGGALIVGRYGPSADEFFNGSIDDVRIYNYARTAAEIRSDYNAGMGTYFK
ncbi:MAG: LamG domain-containing protein [Candidatus Pacebacteria bacterium]|nr:LamG domain-containing protein [Candidatus Paceibacterota bacterium]